jgi:hypothetical protein
MLAMHLVPVPVAKGDVLPLHAQTQNMFIDGRGPPRLARKAPVAR